MINSTIDSIGSLSQSSLCSSSHQTVCQLRKLKKHLVEELIVSEVKYIGYLKKILQYFADPLFNNGLLPRDIHGEIFGHIQPIVCVNEALLESLLSLGVEEAFAIIAPCLKLYADYARRYQTMLVLIETCITFNADLFHFIEQQESSPEINQQLSSLLIMPIQRIPRYSLLLQELLVVYLQLGGMSSSEARYCVDRVLLATQSRQVIPEQVGTSILGMHDCWSARQPYPEYSQLQSDLMFLGQYLPRMRFRTVRLLAAFGSISAIATYLNEQIRISQQADMSALLQTRLLGRWTDNLLIVPGRRLLRYGWVNKPNELTGRSQPRLFVLLSDILIYAAPRKLFTIRPPAKLARIRSRHCAKQQVTTPSFAMNRLRQKHRGPLSLKLLDARSRRRSVQRQTVQKAWLNSVTRSTTDSMATGSLFANKHVRFSCVAVYPLHHCSVLPHFIPTSQLVKDQVSAYHDSFTGDVDSAESVTLVEVSDNATTSAHRSHLSDHDWSSQPHLSHSSLARSGLNESNTFTIRCRDAAFTVAVDNRETAEDWISSLDSAIQAVIMARQSLRKASSAKRPMPMSDFIRYEQWLDAVRSKNQAADTTTSEESISEALGILSDTHSAHCMGFKMCGLVDSLSDLLRPSRQFASYKPHSHLSDVQRNHKRQSTWNRHSMSREIKDNSDILLVNVTHASPNGSGMQVLRTSHPRWSTDLNSPPSNHDPASSDAFPSSHTGCESVHRSNTLTSSEAFSLPFARRRQYIRNASGKYANLLDWKGNDSFRDTLTAPSMRCCIM